MAKPPSSSSEGAAAQGDAGDQDFAVDSNTFVQMRIRAAFYPKFDNEKSDQEARTRMIGMVSDGLCTMEVTLKHSGSLFMYAGYRGGAYTKNTYGNIYTAVGVFILDRMFREAWGEEAPEMQAEFNDYLEINRLNISMELVTAVLGDHGQRPNDDYVVVTAVTELGHSKPNFYSTPEVIAFCRKWRLPTNHVWLFSTRESAASFFAAYDALCEEGTATPVCKVLNEIADISVPGSKDHVIVQGEILEGLVARIVSRESSFQMEEVLRNFPQPPLDGVDSDLGPSVREICDANRLDEEQKIKELLQNVGSSLYPDHSDWFGNSGLDAQSRKADELVVTYYLQAHPTDYVTKKLQEMIRLMKQLEVKQNSFAIKCYGNYQKVDSLSNDNRYYKMVIHVYSDTVFTRYQQEMKKNRGLWPLYRGFFVDVNLFKANNKKAAELTKRSNILLNNVERALDSSSSAKDGLTDEDSNLMVKLKFLPYKIRTFLIRKGLHFIFKDKGSDYSNYCLRQMEGWGTSPSKQNELCELLDKWAVHVKGKYGNKPLSPSTYLSEAEPFLEQYAKCSSKNHALIGAAGDLVQAENFLVIPRAQRNEEDNLQPECGAAPSSPTMSPNVVSKTEGLIVFFPGIPGCAKSALCNEILKMPGGLGDDRPIHSFEADRTRGKYWQVVAKEQKKDPIRITLADKNAPNEDVWQQIEDMCRTTKAAAAPVIPDSEGTNTNPFCFEALAVFMFRVLKRVDHPGNLDKDLPDAGNVLLMFYKLYDGKSRREFESELYDRFGCLVKMPLLKPDRAPLPGDVKSILVKGLSLFRLHRSKRARGKPPNGSYASEEWKQWEERLREILFGNEDYLKSIQNNKVLPPFHNSDYIEASVQGKPPNGSYASEEWKQWEERLREILFGNEDYLKSIQVPFDVVVKEVVEQLQAVAKGEIRTPDTPKRRFGNIVFAAVTLSQADILGLLRKVAEKDIDVNNFLNNIKLEDKLNEVHVTLAHKRAHGVAAVASYAVYQNQEVPVSFSAFLYNDKMAALEAQLGMVNGETIVSRNDWPHGTLWTATGAPKEANTLPQLVSKEKAKRVLIDPPIAISGVLHFY